MTFLCVCDQILFICVCDYGRIALVDDTLLKSLAAITMNCWHMSEKHIFMSQVFIAKSTHQVSI